MRIFTAFTKSSESKCVYCIVFLYLNELVFPLEFKQKCSKRQSVVLYDDFSNLKLSTSIVAKLLRNTDKQFMDLNQFREEGKNYINEMIA